MHAEGADSVACSPFGLGCVSCARYRPEGVGNHACEDWLGLVAVLPVPMCHLSLKQVHHIREFAVSHAKMQD